MTKTAPPGNRRDKRLTKLSGPKALVLQLTAISDAETEREIALRNELRRLFPQGDQGDAAARMIAVMILIAAGLRKESGSPAFTASVAPQREQLRRLRKRLQSLVPAVEECKQYLAVESVIVDGRGTDAFRESLDSLRLMIDFVDRAIARAKPSREDVWVLAVSMRDLLEHCGVKLTKTLAGTWAEGVRIMLAFIDPMSDDDAVDAKLETLVRGWAREIERRAPSRVPEKLRRRSRRA